MKRIFTITLIFFLSFTGTNKAQQIILGTGTGVSVFSPLNRTNDYCVYEIIYLNSEINIPGTILKFAFERTDGSDVAPIENVNIYMNNTSSSSLSNSNYSNAGYTLVYSGDFPNDTGSGWREVTLDNPFFYDSNENLAVLVVKGYQPRIANTPVTPRWYYTLNTTGTNRARRYYGNDSISNSTPLTSLNYNANARLEFGTVGIREIIPGNCIVYPNPSSNHVKFKTSAATNSIFIFNSTGEIITRLYRNSSEEFSIENLNPGIYFYEFYTEPNGFSTKGKFIVL